MSLWITRDSQAQPGKLLSPAHQSTGEFRRLMSEFRPLMAEFAR
jgi:hypothetical protein